MYSPPHFSLKVASPAINFIQFGFLLLLHPKTKNHSSKSTTIYGIKTLTTLASTCCSSFNLSYCCNFFQPGAPKHSALRGSEEGSPQGCKNLVAKKKMWCVKNEALVRTLNALFLGQLVSFVLALMSFTASLNASLGVDTPLCLSFITYLSLTLVYGGILVYRRQKLLVPWYWYALLGFIDVQGNYLTNIAFQFTSITSVTLLDCFTIAWVIILTWLILGTHYSLWQFVGAAVCVIGLALVFLSDAGVGGGGGSKPLLGDMLVIAATFFFAVSNTGEEFCVKRKDRVEVVAMIGFFGMLVSMCEIAMLERKNLVSIKWSAEIIIGFVAYAVASFLFYTFVPIVLKMSGATMFNLSVLTSDMWAVVIRIFFYQQQVDWLYYLSFGIVVIGLIIYSKVEKDPVSMPGLVDGNPNSEYQLFNGESADSPVESLTA